MVSEGKEGVAEFAANPPLIVTGDNYQSGIGVRYESGRSTMLFDSDVHINIFNVDKINKEEGPRGTPRLKRLQETIGERYYEYPESAEPDNSDHPSHNRDAEPDQGSCESHAGHDAAISRRNNHRCVPAGHSRGRS